MCIFNVFKMYSVILFFCKVNTTYLKFEIFLVVVLYPRHIIMYQFRTENQYGSNLSLGVTTQK